MTNDPSLLTVMDPPPVSFTKWMAFLRASLLLVDVVEAAAVAGLTLSLVATDVAVTAVWVTANPPVLLTAADVTAVDVADVVGAFEGRVIVAEDFGCKTSLTAFLKPIFSRMYSCTAFELLLTVFCLES